jgi:hypothetical protein
MLALPLYNISKGLFSKKGELCIQPPPVSRTRIHAKKEKKIRPPVYTNTHHILGHS